MAKQPKKKADPIPGYRRAFTKAAGIFMILILFAVRMHIETLSGQSLTVFAHTNGITADWFLYCKELLLFCAACGIVLYTAGERVFPDHPCRENPLFTKQARFPALCIAGYFLLTVLSGIFSENREVVWQGNAAEYEGIMGITGYCVLFLFGYNFLSERRCLRFFRRALTVLCAAAAVLAVIDYAFVMLLELPFMKYLIAPAEYRETAASLKSRDTFREAVLMFYNSNYAGAFFVLVFPVTFYGLCTAKTLPKRILAAVLCAGVFAAGIMTNATTAFYLMALEFAALTVYFLVKRAVSLRAVGAVLASFAVLTAALNFAADGDFLRTLRKNIVNEGSYSAAQSVYRLKKAELNGKSLHIQGQSSGYTITPPYDTGESVTAVPDDGTVCTVSQTDFAHITVHDAAADTDIIASVEEGML
ncbi:MAG: hypothetical protein IK130_10860, partial [Oscillospiraceae bacterium]|nr:hypothetical protein [Oscillospiraceae bacterium]